MENKKLIEKGILYIEQFYDKQKNDWYTCEQFINKYTVDINFLDYLTIVKNIPKEWKKIIKLNIGPEGRDTLATICKKQNKISRYIYNDSLENRPDLSGKNRIKWEQIVDKEITPNKWQVINVHAYSITNCTKLRWFQFRTLHHVLTTNVTRHRWNKDIKPYCYYCQNETLETITHLFVMCPKIIQNIWKPLKRWLAYFVMYNWK